MPKAHISPGYVIYFAAYIAKTKDSLQYGLRSVNSACSDQGPGRKENQLDEALTERPPKKLTARCMHELPYWQ